MVDHSLNLKIRVHGVSQNWMKQQFSPYNPSPTKCSIRVPYNWLLHYIPSLLENISIIAISSIIALLVHDRKAVMFNLGTNHSFTSELFNKFSLIQSGWFVHKWDHNLNAVINSFSVFSHFNLFLTHSELPYDNRFSGIQHMGHMDQMYNL